MCYIDPNVDRLLFALKDAHLKLETDKLENKGLKDRSGQGQFSGSKPQPPSSSLNVEIRRQD